VVDSQKVYAVLWSSLYKVSYTSEFYKNPFLNEPSQHQLSSFKFAQLALSSRLNCSLVCIYYLTPCYD